MQFFRNLKVAAILISSLLGLSSCKIESVPVTLTVNSGGLTCAATTSLSSVVSGNSFPVTINVVGGAGPYTLSGVTGTFLTSYTLPQTLSISGSTSQIRSASFTVTDSAGKSTTCNLSVTVTPVADPTPLSCSVAASTETPAINQSVTYTATATGGSGSYFFTGFIPGGNGVNTASLTKINDTQATAGARYPNAGLNTAVFYISDTNSNSATCAKTVNVQSGPTVSLTASPSSTVPATQAITVTATPSNFTGTPTYVYSVSGTGINLSSSGAVATVTAVDSTITRTGTVTVTATSGSQVATSSIPVTFTASTSTLNCSISYTPGTYYPNDAISYSITATTGEALVVTEINVQDGTVVGGYPSQYPSIRFYYSGSKRVTARARSASTGISCNNGALLESTIYISPGSTAFSCSLTLNPNPTYTYRWILATVTASGAQGSYWLESLTADTAYMTLDTSTTSGYDSYLTISSDINRWVYFTRAGNWKVTARLRDQAGRTATCDTYEVIYQDYYQGSSQFCGINPATGLGACTQIYRDSYYYDGYQCRYYGVTSGCAASGVFSSYNECITTVNAGRCGSW